MAKIYQILVELIYQLDVVMIRLFKGKFALMKKQKMP